MTTYNLFEESDGFPNCAQNCNKRRCCFLVEVREKSLEWECRVLLVIPGSDPGVGAELVAGVLEETSELGEKWCLKMITREI